MHTDRREAGRETEREAKASMASEVLYQHQMVCHALCQVSPAASSDQKVWGLNPTIGTVNFQCFAHNSKMGMPMGIPIGSKIF